jgi:hypothetical protein
MNPDQERKRLDIDVMIANEDDPKQRAFLVILNSINNSLVANTQTTVEVAAKLDKHLTVFEAQTKVESESRNRNLGMLKGVSYFMGLVQIIVTAAVGYVFNDLSKLHTQTNELQIMATKNSTRIDGLETRIKGLEGK